MTGLMESVGTIRASQIIYIYVTVLLMCVVPGKKITYEWWYFFGGGEVDHR